MKRYLILALLTLFKCDAFADVKAVIKPYLYNGDSVLDSQIKVEYNDQFKVSGTIIPLQFRPGVTVWDAIPEFYASVKSDSFGKITIGSHNADVLLVDAGSFAIGNSDILRDGNHLYSQSLISELQPQGYKYKLSYLLKRDNFYLSLYYSPFDGTKQARVLYANSLSSTTDFKASVGVVNDKVVSGFNLRFLGFIFGGSYSGDFYNAGVGYSIGPFDSSFTYLSYAKNTVLGFQYNLSKNISPYIQIGYSTKNGNTLSTGVNLNF